MWVVNRPESDAGVLRSYMPSSTPGVEQMSRMWLRVERVAYSYSIQGNGGVRVRLGVALGELGGSERAVGVVKNVMQFNCTMLG